MNSFCHRYWCNRKLIISCVETMIENETTEFKKTLGQLKDGIISIAAILNKHGEGELWFGVRDDGVPVGVAVGEKTVRDISQAIAAHIEPKIYPEISTEPLDGVQCIRVRFSGTEIPYSAYGRAYMRVADEDRQLSKQEQENLILRNKRSAMRWDNEPCKASLDDLDEEKVKTFVERAGLSWDSLPNTLEKLDLLVDGKLVNTAPLFFAKKPFTRLRCAVFGTTSTSFIIDRQEFDGDILTLIEEAQKYVLKNIHIGMRLEGLYRVDVPEIALPALREAVINAFCHRDYRDLQKVQVAIFKDRVETRNPGTLFGGFPMPGSGWCFIPCGIPSPPGWCSKALRQFWQGMHLLKITPHLHRNRLAIVNPPKPIPRNPRQQRHKTKIVESLYVTQRFL